MQESQTTTSESWVALCSYALAVFSTITQMARAGVCWVRVAVNSQLSGYRFMMLSRNNEAVVMADVVKGVLTRGREIQG